MSAWVGLAQSAGEVARSRFARNWSLLVTSNLLVQTLAMLATIRIARVLAPQGYGAFNLVQALAVLGALLAGLGTRQVLIRACAREPRRTRQLLAAASVLRVAPIATVGVGIVIYSALSQEELTPTLGLLAVAAMAGLCAWDLLESVAFGHQRMSFSSALSLLGAVAWLVWAWTVPEAWLTPISVSIAFAVVQVVRVLAYIVLVRRAGWLSQTSSRIMYSEWRRDLLEPALPFYWLAIVTALTSQVPILFLAARAGQAEVGLYNVGFRLVTPLQMLLVTAFTALYPGLSRAATTANSPFDRMVRGALIGTVALGTAGALLISALRDDVVLLLFGADYLAAADEVAALCWSSVLLALSTLMGTILAARDQQKSLAAASTVYAALALPIFWFAAGEGASGLAFGLAVTSGLGLVCHWLVFQRVAQPLPTTFGAALASILVLGMGFTWGLARPMIR